MKQVLEYVDYFTACVNAISKGVKTALAAWPSDSPFSSGAIKDSGDGVEK